MPSKSGREDDEGMDVDKDGVLGDDSPLIVKNTTRVADEREVDEFVKTFKHYGLTGMISLSPTVRVIIRLHSSCGVSHGDYSRKPERGKRCVDVLHSRRLISHPDEGQRGHSHAPHEA